jgi:dienelactone hydrolase
MGLPLLIFLLWWVSLFLLGLAIGTVAHKAGRLLCARVGSIPIRRIVIGRGPTLMRGRLGDIRLEVRLVPTGMVVICAESASPPKRSAVLLYLLGGVLANIVVIGVIIWLHRAGLAPPILRNDAGMPLLAPQAGILIFAQLMMIGVGVAEPFFYARSPQIKRYREGTTRPPISTRSLAFVRVLYRVVLHERLHNQDTRRKAWAAVQRELARGDLTPEEEMYALDWVITNWLITSRLAAAAPIFVDPSLRRKLDEWSDRAVRLGPKIKTLVASRAAVLVELGRYREAKALLQSLVSVKGAPLLDALLNRLYLARAEHALGNAAAARRLIGQAQAIVRAEARPPMLVAWMRLIHRTAREMRSRRPRAQHRYDRRSLKGQAKLPLLGLRYVRADQTAPLSPCSPRSLAIAFVISATGLAMSLLLAVAFVPEPDQSRMHTTAPAGARPDTNPPPDPQRNENVVKVPVTLTLQDGTLHKGEFVLTTFKPDGPGPFPAVVVSHGRDGSLKGRAEFGRAEYGASSWMYHYWTLRGFAVLAPTRIGYGVSGTDVDPEILRGSCDSLDFAPAASAVSAHIRATIEYAATQAWIDSDNIVLAGESSGGFGSIIAAGQRLPGVKAVVNFAGGAAGQPRTQPEQPCSPQNVELLLIQAARQGAVPSIWFYAENDRFWGAKLPRTWHTAYIGAGGTAEFHMLPPLAEDGHGVVAYGFEHWRPRLDRFLNAMGYALRKLPWGAPQRAGFAPLERSPPVANLSGWCVGAYDRFLMLEDLPRAFAISPNGGCTYSWGALDVMMRVLASCQQRYKEACKLYAVNDDVVWVP